MSVKTRFKEFLKEQLAKKKALSEAYGKLLETIRTTATWFEGLMEREIKAELRKHQAREIEFFNNFVDWAKRLEKGSVTVELLMVMYAEDHSHWDAFESFLKFKWVDFPKPENMLVILTHILELIKVTENQHMRLIKTMQFMLNG